MIPLIYKNDLLQPCFADVIYELYNHIKPFDELFSDTVNSTDVRCRDKYADELLVSGYSPDDQRVLESLSYENRKQKIFDEEKDVQRVFETQRRSLDHLLSELNNGGFKKIDIIMADMYQFVDLCHFNFTSMLRIFDTTFSSQQDYEPRFQAVYPRTLEHNLEDLYFLTANIRITTSLEELLNVLLQIHNSGVVNDKKQSEMGQHLRMIFSAIKNILNRDVLVRLIALAKSEPSASPAVAEYKKSMRQQFAARLKEHFDVDEQRIRLELKNETTASDLHELFGDKQLEELSGYDLALDDMLRLLSPVSLVHLKPMQILKTFLSVYLSDPIKSVLNDIAIEGFFDNAAVKTSYSSAVYNCTEASNNIANFEASFEHGKPHDVDVLRGYISDSHDDRDFMKKLIVDVNLINTEANALLTTTLSDLYSLHAILGDILADSKRTSHEVVSNLKILLLSSRNRDKASLLDKQYPSWKLFFDIMKNYVAISKDTKK